MLYVRSNRAYTQTKCPQKYKQNETKQLILLPKVVQANYKVQISRRV